MDSKCTSSRDEFSLDVKRRIAERAGNCCSNPNCNVSTIAGTESCPKSVVRIGRACHIAAAAKNGPRYDSSQTPVMRRSIDNAIYLCANCADMVDRNNGKEFSAEKLRGWKALREEKVMHSLNRKLDAPVVVDGIHEATGVGTITGLDIQGPAILRPGTISRATGVGTVIATRIGGHQ